MRGLPGRNTAWCALPDYMRRPATRSVIVTSADLDADDEVRAYNRMRAVLDDRVRSGEQTPTASAASWPTHHPNAPLAGRSAIASICCRRD